MQLLDESLVVVDGWRIAPDDTVDQAVWVSTGWQVLVFLTTDTEGVLDGTLTGVVGCTGA